MNDFSVWLALVIIVLSFVLFVVWIIMPFFVIVISNKLDYVLSHLKEINEHTKYQSELLYKTDKENHNED